MSQQRRIVVGIDGSAGSVRAGAVAAQLAVGLDAELIAVHAFEPMALLGEVAPPVDFSALRADALAALQGPWTEALRAAGVAVRCLLVEDRPVHALLRVAGDEAADHIVIGTRGTGGFTGLVLGSVALSLPAASSVPVTIVPPDER